MPATTRRRAVLLLLLAGAVLRLSYIHAHSAFMQSDEALVGLEAKHILTSGHLPIFDYGEERGGALFMYLVAPFFALLGVSNLVFKAVATAVSLLLIYLLYRLARRAGGDRVGLLALALLALGPPFFIMWSLHGAAQYVVMMVCGAASLLLCDDLLFQRGLNRPPLSPQRRRLTYALLGLLLGIGLWESPLIISFLAAVWITLFLHDRRCFFRSTFLIFLLAFVVANLPAILFNALPQLRAAAGLAGTPNWISYTSLVSSSGGSPGSSLRELPATLAQVAQVSIPAVLGGVLWPFDTGWLRRTMALLLIAFWTVALLHLLWQRLRLWWGEQGARHWRLTTVDAPLLTFLLALLVFVLSQYRYLVREPRYLLAWFAFLPMAGALFLERLSARRKRLAGAVLVAVLALNVVTTVWFPPSLDPDHGLFPKDQALLDHLIENDIRHPIADFWIAYSTAFETDERIVPVSIGYYKSSFYPELLAGPLATQYILPKREKDDRYFQFFRYGLVGRQWSAQQFAAYLQDLGIPAAAYQAHEFEHYVLFDVPRQYLDPAVVSSTTDELRADPLTSVSRTLSGLARAGDALLLNPPDLAEASSALDATGLQLYGVPDALPPDQAAAAEVLADLAGQHSRLFVLLGDTARSDPEAFVEHWLAQHTFPAEQRWIGPLRLGLYVTTPFPAAEQPSVSGSALLGDQIEWTGLDLPTTRPAPGQALPLTLFWQARQPIAPNLKVFVHLLDAAGQLAAQRDSEPQAGLRPTSTWAPGEPIIDRHALLLPDDLPPGEYTLLAGLYDPANGQRLPVTNGPPGAEPDALRLGVITVGQ